MEKSTFRIIMTDEIGFTITKEEKENVSLEEFLNRIHSQPWLEINPRIAVQVSQIQYVEKLK